MKTEQGSARFSSCEKQEKKREASDKTEPNIGVVLFFLSVKAEKPEKLHETPRKFIILS